MNDFTKDELEELLMWSTHLAGCNPYLLKKIKSMIGGYCEHEWIRIPYLDSGEGRAKCGKCGTFPNTSNGNR